MNSDNKDDLVLIDGNRLRIWMFKTRAQTSLVEADLDRTIPSFSAQMFISATVGDLEGDGKPDLLIYGGVWSQPQLIFDFATSTPELRNVSQFALVKNALIHSWDPTEKPVIIAVGKSANTVISGDSRVLRVLEDRSLSLLEEIPGEGVPVNLDGQFPPEFVDFSERWVTGKGMIRAKTGGTWSVVNEFSIASQLGPAVLEQDFPNYPSFQEVVTSVADFYGNGREQLIFTPGSSPAIYGLQSEGSPSAATLSSFPPLTHPVSSLSSVKPIFSNKAHLTVFSTPRNYNALGNPLPGFLNGSRAWLRRDAFNPFVSRNYVLGPRRVPSRLVVADFNGDLLPDVGTLHSDEGQFSVFKGPVWQAPQPARAALGGGFSGDSLVVGDFTGDQIPDVLLPKSREIATIKTVRQPASTPDLTFSLLTNYPFSSGAPSAPDRVLGAADFDSDGDTDALVFNPQQETLAWLENTQGNGTAMAQRPIALAGRWWTADIYSPVTGRYKWLTQDQVFILDADRDGDCDIVTGPSALGNVITLHRNQGGAFSLVPLTDLADFSNPQNPWPAAGHHFVEPPSHLLAGRFINSPNPIQFAICGRTIDSQFNSSTSITVAHGSIGTMQYGQPDTIPDFASAVVCDFNGDGLDDLVTSSISSPDSLGNPSSDTSIRLHRSLGDGSFAESSILANPRGFISHLVAADFTGDGLQDIMAASRDTGVLELYSHAMVPAYPSYSGWIALFPGIDPAVTADPDGDGISNILEFARGTPPNSAQPLSPPTPVPPVAVEIRIPTNLQTDIVVTATHPRPRLENGDFLDVVLESSSDLISWSSPQFSSPKTAFDLAHPQWDTLSWSFPVFPSSGNFFYRFKVVYRAQ